MAAACSCIQSVLLLIHHPHLCCQLGNTVHFCTWNQGKAMRNYFSPQKFNCLQREQEKLHFDLSLITIWAVRDRLRSPSINSQFMWRDFFFFWKQRHYWKQWNTLANVTSHSQWDFYFFLQQLLSMGHTHAVFHSVTLGLVLSCLPRDQKAGSSSELV